mmetsp:Transcript_33965/g.61306  ORF Transcript_33965/g.61306 Transcript_33965/m.61306 type:complete len:260 (-) Transcript_33965:805-1584(-)
MLLELVDDLHGAHFGRAADGSNGESGSQGIPSVKFGKQLSSHGTANVHDMGVPFDLHELLHNDTPGFRHLPDIVAAEIHQHHVLGALLLVGQELGFQGAVGGGVYAAGAGAGQRSVSHATVGIDTAQNLGAAADDVAATSLHVHHVRTGVNDAEGAVDLEGGGKGPAFESVTQDKLKDVAALDVLLGLLHRLHVLGLGHVRGSGGFRDLAEGKRDGGRGEGGEGATDRGIQFIHGGGDAAAAVLVAGTQLVAGGPRRRR